MSSSIAFSSHRVTDEVIKEIAVRLQDEDRGVREAAINALAALKDRVTDEVIKEIAGWLRDKNMNVRADTYGTLKIFYESGIPSPLENSF